MATKIARVKSMSPADIQARFQSNTVRSRSNSRNRTSTVVQDAPPVHYTQRPRTNSKLGRNRTFTPADRAAHRRGPAMLSSRRRSRSQDDILRDLQANGFPVSAAAVLASRKHSAAEAPSAVIANGGGRPKSASSISAAVQRPKISVTSTDTSAAGDAQNGSVLLCPPTEQQMRQMLAESNCLTESRSYSGGGGLAKLARTLASHSVRPSPEPARRSSRELYRNRFDVEAQKKLSTAILHVDRVAAARKRNQELKDSYTDSEPQKKFDDEKRKRKSVLLSKFSCCPEALESLKMRLASKSDQLMEHVPDLSLHESFGHHASIFLVAMIAFSTFAACVTVLFLVFYL